MPPVKNNEHNSLPHFNRVHFVLDHNSNACIQPRGVVKLPSENPLEQTISFFPLGNKCWCFPVWGWNPVFTSHFQCQSPHLTWTFVCLCVLLQSLSVHVFINFFFSWNLLQHLALSIFLPPLLTTSAPWYLREGFHKAFQLGLSITRHYSPSALL